MGAIDDPIHLIDGVPIPVCQYARASRCQKFKGEATFGYCAAKDQKYYGFNGCIANFGMAGSTVDERDILWEMSDGISGLTIGDKG